MDMGDTHVVHTLPTDPGKDRAVADRPNSPCRAPGTAPPTKGPEQPERPERPEQPGQPEQPDPEVPTAVRRAEEPFQGVSRPVEAVQGLERHLHQPCRVALEPAPLGLSPRRVKHPAL